MGEKEVVNLSSFLLFEQTGDSEADSHGKMAVDYDQDYAFDDADAESCSSDVGCYVKSGDPQAEISKQVFTKTHCSDDVGGSDGIRNDIHAITSYHPHHHQHKIRGFEDEDEMISEVTSTANSRSLRKGVQSKNISNMSEMEKSKLFWEACLASSSHPPIFNSATPNFTSFFG